MLFFRVLQHLLPQATAWRITVQKTLRSFFEGLAVAPSDVRDFADAAWLDIFPTTTRELDRYETQFGLTPAATDAARRQQYAAAWSAQGGQSPKYLQDVVRAAGFDVYLHEWWIPGTQPPTKRDPRAYTTLPEIGTVQCGEPLAQCTEPDAPQPDPLPVGVEVWELYPQCNEWLVNDPGYLVNRDLTRRAPPPVPSDPARWPYFVYWCGETFGQKANVPAARRGEFERLLLKLCPEYAWIVIYVDYV